MHVSHCADVHTQSVLVIQQHGLLRLDRLDVVWNRCLPRIWDEGGMPSTTVW